MKPILWVISLSLLLRLALPVAILLAGGDGSAFCRPDSAGYLALGDSLGNEGVFATGGVAEINRTPGYPVFLLPGVLTGLPIGGTVVLQIILSSLTVGLTFRLGQRIFKSDRTALLASLLLAVDPLSVLFASRILTETCFAFALLLALVMASSALDSGRLSSYLFAALALSAAVYLRPIVYFLPLFFALFFLIHALLTRRRDKRLTGAGSALAFFMVCVCLIGAWQLRNRNESGYSGFSSISAINLYFYNSAAVQAKLDGRSFYEEQKRRGYHDRSQYYLQYPEQREWSEPRQLSFMAREGAKLIGENWQLYAGIHFSGMLRCLLDPGAVEYLRAFGRYPNLGGLLGRLVDQGFLKTALTMRCESPGLFWLNFVMGVFLLVVLGGVAPGILHSLKRCRWVTLLILLTLLYLLLLSGGPAALSRFRVPLMPVFALFSGLGLERGVNWLVLRFGGRSSSQK